MFDFLAFPFLHPSTLLLQNGFTLVHVLLPIDLHPDVNLKRTGIEIDDNNSSQCRVQFIIFVSDSIYMYVYLHNKPMCACTYINTFICMCGVYMHVYMHMHTRMQ